MVGVGSNAIRLRTAPERPHPGVRRGKAGRRDLRARGHRRSPWRGATPDRALRRRRVLAVAIMAHNEERCIGDAIESVFAQQAPAGFDVQVIVVANACTDGTAAVVRRHARRHPRRVVLLSAATKGKTVAIQHAVRFLERSPLPRALPYVVFLDADCEFAHPQVLANIVRRFEAQPELGAVAAQVRPDVLRNARTDLVAEMYRAVYRLAGELDVNTISGMCYGIRFEELRRIDFPAMQLAEDMFVAARLDGWFATDPGATVLFRTPKDLGAELARRARQEVSTRRYLEYYRRLASTGVRVKLREGALGDEYRWHGSSNAGLVRTFLAQPGLWSKALVAASFVVLAAARVRAGQTLRALRQNVDLDYWFTAR
jgi:glycosyltransferase involved in cell wall biosynthesis